MTSAWAPVPGDLRLNRRDGGGAAHGVRGGHRKAAGELDIKAVRARGVKEASVEMNGMSVKVAVTNGLSNARKSWTWSGGLADYHIEIRACPGQHRRREPDQTTRNEAAPDAVYLPDRSSLRKSHENPAVKALYEEYRASPTDTGRNALLHTAEVNRSGLGGGARMSTKCSGRSMF